MSGMVDDIVEMTVEGQQLRWLVRNPSDAIMQYHAQGKLYEPEELAWLKQHCRDTGVLVDIGANVGNHAVYAARCTSIPRIIVFEPNRTAISILQYNLLLNHCDNVDTQFLGLALGAAEGRLTEHSPDPNNLGYTYYSEDLGGDVLAITGDSVLYDEPVSFIKLDAEGMEPEILSGLQRTIQRWRPVMLIEIWDWKTPQFIRWLTRQSYEVVEELRRYDQMWNYLVIPRC
jgi:FkbM family methyltransferase